MNFPTVLCIAIDMLDTYKFQFRWRCTNAGDSLDRYLMLEREKMKSNAKSGFLILFLFPFAAFFQKRWVICVLITLSCYQLYQAVSSPIVSDDFGVSQYRSFQLLQPGSARITTVAAFVLTLRGCDVETNTGPCSQAQAVSNASMGGLEDWECVLSASFSASQEFDGFRLVLAANLSAPRPAIRFLLQGSSAATGVSGDGGPWAGIGTPIIRHVREGVRLLGGELSPFADLAWDLRAPWPLVAHEAVVPAVEGAFFAGLAFCAAAGRVDLGRRMFSALLLSVGLVLAIAGTGYLALSLLPDAMLPLCSAATCAGFWLLLRRSQQLLRYGLVLHGAAALLLRAAADCVLWDDCGDYAVAADIVALVWVLAGTALITLSRIAVARAVAAVAADEEAYAAEWASLASHPDLRRQLQHLAAFTTRIGAHAVGGDRHLERRSNSRWSAPPSAHRGRAWAPWPSRKGFPRGCGAGAAERGDETGLSTAILVP